MSNPSSSVDGFFIPRRQRRPIASGVPVPKRVGQVPVKPSAHSDDGVRLQPRGDDQNRNFFGASGAHALPPIELPGADKPQRARRGKGGGKRFSMRPTKKGIKRTALGILLLAIIVGGYFSYRLFSTTGKLFQGNVLSAILAQAKPLKADQQGRSNILLFGTSEDDPQHDGANLTDSIMVASVDQQKKNVFLISIPRDLWVKFGTRCTSGYEGKINEVYQCGGGEGAKLDEQAGQTAFRTKVTEVTGLDIQYSVHVNYTVLREAVNAVGGINVTIASSDPRGILDRNFDWRCNYKCYYVKYPNGPVNLDGEHALALARARGAAGEGTTYGLPNANFDREKYQQKIIIALKDKATSAGTLANPVAIDKLLSALGNNVRTNFDAEEVKTVISIAKDSNTKDINTIPLNDPQDPLVTTGSINGASVVQPIGGLYNYDALHRRLRALVSGDAALLEKAKVDVLNASGQAGTAGSKADKVTAAGIVVEVIGNAPKALDTAPLRIYDLSNGKKPATLKKLEMLFGTKAIKSTPEGVTSGSDFVIIVGSNGTP